MFINGAYRILYIDFDDGYFPIGCLTSNSFNEESDTLETTTRDNAGWKTFKATNQSYTIPFDGLLLEDELANNLQTYYDLTQIKRDRTVINWKIDELHYGTGIITYLSNENTVDENVTFSAELIGYGKPLILLDVIFNAYSERSIADGGFIDETLCLKKYINSIIKD